MARHRISRRPVRRGLTTLVAVVALVALATGVAVAFWRSTGAGAGTASTASLHVPTSVTASSTAGTGVVSVSWTTSVGSPAPTGYYVVRLDSGNNAVAACGTSASSTITATTCSDTAVPVGTYTYEAVAADHNWTATSAASVAVTVAKANQAITFTSSAPSNAVFNGPTYTVTATGGGSGNAVTFTIDASATSVCSISGSVVSFVGAGTCMIDANQAGGTYYNAAPQAQQSFAVAQASQTIHFTSTAPASATVGGTGYTPAATGGGSGNPVTFTIDSTTATKCAISGGVVTFQHVGSCTVDANQAGNTDYSAALQVQQSFAIGQGAQAITYTSTAPNNATVNGATYTVTATGGGSGNPVTFSVDAAASSVCTISGAVVSFIAGGTCVIDANQAANTDYLAASQVQQSFAVAKASQTITTFTAPTTGAVGGSGSLSASASSGLAVSFSSATTSICTVTGSTVTYVAVGTCTVNANQSGNGSYTAAPQVQRSISVDAAQFSVSAGATQVAGTAFTATITAQDTGGSTVASYTGSHSMTLTSTAGNSPSGATPTLPSGSLNFTNGVATVSVTLVDAQTGRTITASDGTASGTSNSITVSAGTAAKLAWTHVAVSAGTLSNPCLFTCTDTALGNFGTFTANVSVTDALGNTVTGLGTGHTVTVAASAGAFTAPSAGSSVTLTIGSTGAADSTQQLTFKAQNGSWTSDSLSASSLAGTTYAGATATVTKQ